MVNVGNAMSVEIRSGWSAAGDGPARAGHRMDARERYLPA
jgi:hypothetical protein